MRYGQPWEHLIAFLDTKFDRSTLAEASASACATVTFNRRPVSLHMSQLNLTTAGAGILNQLSIVYALRPRLRSRLTLGGRTFPRKPWVYGESEFNRLYRYSCLHPRFRQLQFQSPSTFTAAGTLPYQSDRPKPIVFQSFGIPLIANHYRREITR